MCGSIDGYCSMCWMSEGHGSVKGVEGDVSDSGKVGRRVEIGKSRIC